MRKFLFMILCLIITFTTTYAQTKGSLAINVATKGTGVPGKNYAPRNIIVIWIEDESGNFVKTLLLNARERMTHLNNWESSTADYGSTYNAVDAVTSATNNSHGTRSCTWDGMDINGNLMPDGDYILVMELTDLDATGRLSEFSFKKGPDSFELAPKDQTSFASISIKWNPN